MKTITITVEVEGDGEVTRSYVDRFATATEWGERVVDMLDTLEKASDVNF